MFPHTLSGSKKIAGDCHGCGKDNVRHCTVSALHADRECADCHGTGIVQRLHYAGCPNRNRLVHEWIDTRVAVTAVTLTIVPDLVEPSATVAPDISALPLAV